MYKYNVGDRVIVLFGCPHFDYHSSGIIDLMPELVGKMGVITNIVGGYPFGKGVFTSPSYQLDITDKSIWFRPRHT